MAVNIIIPIHDTEPALFRRAIYSLGAQTTNNFVVTVIDDASNEYNSNIYKNILNKFERLTSYVKLDNNVGPGMARQHGINNSISEYIMFLDADDILMPRAVEILHSEAKINNADIVISDILIEGSHRSKSGLIKLGANTTWTHGKIYKKNFLNKYNIKFPNEFIMNEDSYFNLICLALAERKFNVEEALYLWSYNKNSITRTENYDFNIEYNLDYFIGQCMALKFILSYRPDFNFGGTLGHLYNSYQYSFEQNIIKDISRMTVLLIDIFSMPIVYENINKKEIKEYAHQIAKHSLNGIDFLQSYQQWIKEYIGGMKEYGIKR